MLIYVMSQQYNCLMELYTNFTKFLLFMKMHLPSTFIQFRYVRAKMILHAFMIELDQLLLSYGIFKCLVDVVRRLHTVM